MRWSKLRLLVEGRFAPVVVGRVRLTVTRYRRSHDQEGRWAVVVDDFEVGHDTISTFSEERALVDRIVERDGVSALEAQDRARIEMRDRGHHSMEAFVRSLGQYLSMSIEDCLVSSDAVIRALGLLDLVDADSQIWTQAD